MTESENAHPHLELAREEPAPERRPRRGFRPQTEPDDPRAHGKMLRDRLRGAREDTASDIGGYDNRRLIKIRLAEKVTPEDVAAAAGNIEFVSQEDDKLVLAFAAETQLDEFEMRLASLERTGSVPRRNVIYALQSFDRWTPEDRTGWALRQDGFPDEEPFAVDVELWPRARDGATTRERTAFEAWVRERGGEVLDAVRQPYLTLYRIRCERTLADDLLNHRDVRVVDLPPRIGLQRALVAADIGRMEETPDPPENAPGIVVLDTGLVAGHPVLAPAVGDSQSFLSGAGPADGHGHGTFVSGIALYDDVADCVRNRRFVPELRLFSGRVLDDRNQSDSRLMENLVDEAIRYFVDAYGCRIFNLSYGDLNKPYQGRHVAGLAVTLDALSRELDVLFVVPTGNYEGDEDGPRDWRADYPNYLTRMNAALIDPAPALNALTVGSLARYEKDERWPNDPGYQPVARIAQPSPFTRHGPSVNDAIKPDLVDYGGNVMVNVRTNHRMGGRRGVGELSTSHDFATGRPFSEDAGTSFAAPRVANAAAKILAELPNGSVDLCRALLVAHAHTPLACADLFSGDPEALHRVTGYGLVDRSALYRSLDSCVTLWAEDRIANRTHHFYEIPVPDEFWSGGRRQRALTVALAFRPIVRTTRIDYRAASLSFKLVPADSLDEVARAFNAAVDNDTAPVVKERASGRRFTETARSRGTVQASTWTFKQPSSKMRTQRWFVVVTRYDPVWGRNLSSEHERYALTVVLADRSAEEPRLYARVEARLRERARVRAVL